jgi:hypothetical protein
MKNLWGYIFAGVSAIAGIVYLVNEHNNPSVAPVTNVFPPINNQDPTPTSSIEPVTIPAQDMTGTSNVNQDSPKIVPFPVYLV